MQVSVIYLLLRREKKAIAEEKLQPISLPFSSIFHECLDWRWHIKIYNVVNIDPFFLSSLLIR